MGSGEKVSKESGDSAPSRFGFPNKETSQKRSNLAKMMKISSFLAKSERPEARDGCRDLEDILWRRQEVRQGCARPNMAFPGKNSKCGAAAPISCFVASEEAYKTNGIYYTMYKYMELPKLPKNTAEGSGN